MTEFQKYIYNTYLKISRSVKGLPYRFRLDFSNFEEDKNYVTIIKLSNFFNAHKSVNPELFFKAPYEIYDKNETFYLDFYLSARAAKTYTLYLNQIKDSDPDDRKQLDFIVNSARFVYNFCKESNIKVIDYPRHMPASTPSYLQHLLQCNVSIYFLFSFPDFEKNLRSFDWELIKFLLGEDFFSKLDKNRSLFLQSNKCKILSAKAFNKINKN
jgi:hypothetical protein